ncbi:MAG TPA: hypothetical protein PKN32_13885 [Bacteroidales bacterium]|nr:hypothetical protein [Bacteroidales bacterium]
MGKKLFLLVIVGIFSILYIPAQNTRLLKAADDSFENGEKEYNRGHYSEAAPDLEIAVENISITTDSRKYVTMRFEANIMLIDIYFNHLNNLPAACRCLNCFLDDLSRMKNSGILKVKDLLTYLDLEKDYSDRIRQCNNFETIDDKKSEFEKIFDEEFEEDDDE